MTRIPIRVVEAKRPPEPLNLKCGRTLAYKLGAFPPGYFCGTLFGDPVILVEPDDLQHPGLVWPVQNGAYLGTNDKV